MRRGLPATTRRGLVCALVLAAGSACLSEPSGPFGHYLSVTPEALSFAALGDTERLTAVQLGPGSTPLPTPAVEFASVAPAVATVDSGGLVTARSNGVTWVVARAPSGELDSVPVTVVQQPSGVVASRDTLRFEALGAVLPLGANVVDRLGTTIPGLAMEYVMTDTSVATITADGRVHARRNGLTVVRIASVGESLQVVIQVQQRPVRVMTGPDSLRFVALGETGTVVGIAVDSLGHPVPGGGVAQLAVEDTSVLEVVDSVTVRAKRNGQTLLRFSAAGLPANQVGVVSQVPDTIVAMMDDTLPMLLLERDSLIPLVCQVLDRNGQPLSVAPVVGASSGGRWAGSTCEDLRAQRSGLDTLVVRFGSLMTVVPVAIAVRATVSQPLGTFIDMDSLPAGTGPWAPTLLRSESGTFELYLAAYGSGSANSPELRSHLHRLVSPDGRTFRYDGIALERDDSLCSLNGSGIENVAIVPRADSPGWRMFYSSGSFGCYGWQVFSAVSTDRRTWTKEPGVRLSNGGSAPPDAPVTPPWPVGEGIVIEAMSGGGWRMLVGGYRHEQPTEEKWQVVEWRSSDQLTWSYVGPVLTTDDLPATGQRSVYSPTVREFAPGLWRMIMTADNLRDPGGRSRLWSAVSTDKSHWHLEGELMGAAGTDLYYSTLVDDLLVFVRLDAGQPRRLASVSVDMP